MPTGYTCDVQEGKITTLSEFAMRCARAMGATILMRDEPLNATIPAEFEPSDHFLKWKEQAGEELAKLQAMTPEQAEAAAIEECNSEYEAWLERNAERKLQRERYESMLAKVRAWNPPSDEHLGLKKFMIDQLTESIKFDCNYTSDPPLRKSGKQWLEDNRNRCIRNIEQYSRSHEEEVERAKSRTEWVRKLRESVIGL